MSDWKAFCEKYLVDSPDLDDLRGVAKNSFESFGVYPDSINYSEGTYFFMSRNDGKKILVILNEGIIFDKFTGVVESIGSRKAKVCELSNENCSSLRSIFPFTNPVNHRGKAISIGLGDRLGLASAGHVRLIKDLPVFPVLAQQSIRELNLTGRTYNDVLSSAAWAVFQEGYTKGYGADGDHLKTEQEVKMALDCGFTMITLDCSEHIDNTAAEISENEVASRYELISKDKREYLEAKYLNKEFKLSAASKINFNSSVFKRTVLIYLKAITYTIDIYREVIKNCGRKIDFEMSIDETLTSTTPESHFFVASELVNGKVEITSLAPRFCGEFQKGIDYRGDISQFEKEFKIHVEIAEYFGYKISVHSGSDKFSIFPIVGRETAGKYHLKTAGTNWLEAVRIIALENPSLYRRMHKFALENLQEAKKYYHISADGSKVPDIDEMNDSELHSLMDMEEARQVLHITYGLILSAKNLDKTTVFKEEIYALLNKSESNYYSALFKHIGKHLKMLGVTV